MCPILKDRVWKVVHGSGMGITHSGETIDSAYYNRVERNYANDAELRFHSIVGYWRFKDDILVLANSRRLFDLWFSRMSADSEYFELKINQYL